MSLNGALVTINCIWLNGRKNKKKERKENERKERRKKSGLEPLATWDPINGPQFSKIIIKLDTKF